jgi:hypothetical protein
MAHRSVGVHLDQVDQGQQVLEIEVSGPTLLGWCGQLDA